MQFPRWLTVLPSAALTAATVVVLQGAQSSNASPAGQAPSTVDRLLAPRAPSNTPSYLDAVATVSTPSASPGKAFSLWLDVAPKPSMHVYAPGNRDYLPVALTMDAARGVRLGPLQFPKPEVLFFEPLKERVQVYSRPFRLTRTVTVDAAATGTSKDKSGSSLNLSGRLEYQACDDKVCYLPQALPVSWSVVIAR